MSTLDLAQDVEDDGMPPLVDMLSAPNYTFLTEFGSSSLLNIRSSQVTPSTITINSSFNTQSLATTHLSSQLNTEEHVMSTPRLRARSTRTQSKRESTHIPRPPNAFILFRSSFIKSRQIPDHVEGNHSNLSKIIARCWKSLTPDQRAEWEAKAVAAQEEHRQLYPDWRFRPVPYATGKSKVKDGGGPSRRRSGISKTKDPPDSTADDPGDSNPKSSSDKGSPKFADDELRDSRCEKIATLLVEGKTGAELASAVEEWELMKKGKGQKFRPGVPKEANPNLRNLHPITISPLVSGDSPSHLQSSPDSVSPSSTYSYPPTSSETPEPHLVSPSHAHRAKAPIKPISEMHPAHMFGQSPSASTGPSITGFPPPNLDQFNSLRKRPSGKDVDVGSSMPRLGYDNYPRSPPWQTEDGLHDYDPSTSMNPGSYSSWWSSGYNEDPSAKNELLPEIAGPVGLGYENNQDVQQFDQGYDKRYGRFDLPFQGSGAAPWSTEGNRCGPTAIVQDPCIPSPDNAPLSSSTPPLSLLPHEFGSDDPSSSPERHDIPSFYYRQPLPPIRQSSTFPGSSFSTLTDWAGKDAAYRDTTSWNGSPVSSSAATPLHLPSTSSWYSSDRDWSASAYKTAHSMGTAQSSEDWDKVEGQGPSSHSLS